MNFPYNVLTTGMSLKPGLRMVCMGRQPWPGRAFPPKRYEFKRLERALRARKMAENGGTGRNGGGKT